MIDKLETVKDLGQLIEERDQALEFVQIADDLIAHFLTSNIKAEGEFAYWKHCIRPAINWKELRRELNK